MEQHRKRVCEFIHDAGLLEGKDKETLTLPLCHLAAPPQQLKAIWFFCTRQSCAAWTPSGHRQHGIPSRRVERPVDDLVNARARRPDEPPGTGIFRSRMIMSKSRRRRQATSRVGCAQVTRASRFKTCAGGTSTRSETMHQLASPCSHNLPRPRSFPPSAWHE